MLLNAKLPWPSVVELPNNFKPELTLFTDNKNLFIILMLRIGCLCKILLYCTYAFFIYLFIYFPFYKIIYLFIETVT